MLLLEINEGDSSRLVLMDDSRTEQDHAGKERDVFNTKIQGTIIKQGRRKSNEQDPAHDKLGDFQ